VGLVTEPDGVLDGRLLVPFVDVVIGPLAWLEPQHAQAVRDLGWLRPFAVERDRQVGLHGYRL